MKRNKLLDQAMQGRMLSPARHNQQAGPCGPLQGAARGNHRKAGLPGGMHEAAGIHQYQVAGAGAGLVQRKVCIAQQLQLRIAFGNGLHHPRGPRKHRLTARAPRRSASSAGAVQAPAMAAAAGAAGACGMSYSHRAGADDAGAQCLAGWQEELCAENRWSAG